VDKITKSQTMKTQESKQYGLEERTFKFAKNCREFIKQLPKTTSNFEDSKQLARSSGSVHANFIEAVESLSKKDFTHRVKICRKEAKESHSWLLLVDVADHSILTKTQKDLAGEAMELTRIFGSIIEKRK